MYEIIEKYNSVDDILDKAFGERSMPSKEDFKKNLRLEI